MNIKKYRNEVKKELDCMREIGESIPMVAYSQALKLDEDDKNMSVTDAASLCLEMVT